MVYSFFFRRHIFPLFLYDLVVSYNVTHMVQEKSLKLSRKIIFLIFFFFFPSFHFLQGVNRKHQVKLIFFKKNQMKSMNCFLIKKYKEKKVA